MPSKNKSKTEDRIDWMDVEALAAVMCSKTEDDDHQVIGRVDRDGQANQVTVYFPVSDFGSDPVIIDLLGLKSSQSYGIIDPMKAIPEQHSDESRIKLLAESFLNKKS